jgi:hypothetical protein
LYSTYSIIFTTYFDAEEGAIPVPPKMLLSRSSSSVVIWLRGFAPVPVPAAVADVEEEEEVVEDDDDDNDDAADDDDDDDDDDEDDDDDDDDEADSKFVSVLAPPAWTPPPAPPRLVFVLRPAASFPPPALALSPC